MEISWLNYSANSICILLLNNWKKHQQIYTFVSLYLISCHVKPVFNACLYFSLFFFSYPFQNDQDQIHRAMSTVSMGFADTKQWVLCIYVVCQELRFQFTLESYQHTFNCKHCMYYNATAILFKWIKFPIGQWKTTACCRPTNDRRQLIQETLDYHATVQVL